MQISFAVGLKLVNLSGKFNKSLVCPAPTSHLFYNNFNSRFSLCVSLDSHFKEKSVSPFKSDANSYLPSETAPDIYLPGVENPSGV